MANQGKDLPRVARMEMNQHKQGRAAGGKVPTNGLKGDNKAKSGGINRAVKRSMG